MCMLRFVAIASFGCISNVIADQEVSSGFLSQGEGSMDYDYHTTSDGDDVTPLRSASDFSRALRSLSWSDGEGEGEGEGESIDQGTTSSSAASVTTSVSTSSFLSSISTSTSTAGSTSTITPSTTSQNEDDQLESCATGLLKSCTQYIIALVVVAILA